MISTGNESGQLSLEGVGSASSSLSVLEDEEETIVAAIVGRATCSMNSNKLGDSRIGSGRDAITADIESTPLLTGKRSEVTLVGGEWDGDLGTRVLE